ncbi:MAG: exopolysaccharide Pel transporter PelG [Chloroflexota bacterium]|nr:exopolysaccharide Pel transporter PelG [Chloroflexota bacterium]
MAGIGFELKRLFSKEGFLLKLRANLYASVVVSGPMLLGAILLLGVKYISGLAGASRHEQDLLIVVITYSILFPLLLTSTISYVLSRYIADMLFEGENRRILPSLYGSLSLLLIVGAPGWAVFLYLSKLPIEYSLLSFALFCESLVVWMQINYVTAIKNYKSILIGFASGVLAGLLIGYLFVRLNFDVVGSLLVGACIGYGIMLIVYTIVLHKYFPMGSGSSLKFVEWIDKYPALAFVGFFTTLGLFIHLMLMWASPWGVQVHGLFYHAPPHDIPAILAFLTILVTTVNFVTSVEVNFYPRYRLYFSLLNEGGTLGDIRKVYLEMLTVLKHELFYLAQRQMFVTVIAIVVIAGIIDNIGLGFTTMMIGLFRVLCVGYALFAIGNSVMLILLYFADNKGAVFSAFVFCIINTLGTYYTLSLPENYYGFGLAAAGFGMSVVALLRLSFYTKRLEYFVLCKQPIFVAKKMGLLTRLVHKFDSAN